MKYREQGIVLTAADIDSAVYLLRRLIPTLKTADRVLVVAPTFRYSKLVFEAIEQDWYDSGRRGGGMRTDSGREPGPRRDIDRCEFATDAGAMVAFVPVGDGSKHRRSDVVLVVEPDEMPRSVFETLTRGMTDCGGRA